VGGTAGFLRFDEVGSVRVIFKDEVGKLSEVEASCDAENVDR
jgi:hypothetical protein